MKSLENFLGLDNYALKSASNSNSNLNALLRKILLSFLIITSHSAFSQATVIQNPDNTLSKTESKTQIQFGLNAGYDLLPSYSNDYTYYTLKGGLKFGLSADYNMGKWGIGVDYDYLKNTPSSALSMPVFYDTLQITSSMKTDVAESIVRHFIGIGPNLNLNIGNNLDFKLYGRVGLASTKGGELVTTAVHPGGTKVDHHVMFSGIDAAGLGFKAGLGLDYKLTDKIGLNLGAYYLNHMAVTPDRTFDSNNRGNLGMIYGHTPFVTQPSNNYAIGLGAPYIIDAPVDMNDVSSPFTSIGINVGINYLLSSKTIEKKKKEPEVEGTVNAKVIVTVKDEISGKVIPGADVIVKDLNGNTVSSGKTNAYGIFEFQNLKKDNYTISANVFGVETSSNSIYKDDLKPGAIINKAVLYSDLRFILKGNAINKRNRTGEPNVTVSLTHTGNRSVQQESTKGDGGFAFKLDKNSSYEIVGVKENRLSEIKRASTVGLNRSTTLFVNLELGVENFDCGRGTKLDIKYDYDKWALLSESKFELDRIIRYMKDHPNSRVEMSAHTDSRGSSDYNLSLSDKRANSAKTYIQSRGIAPSRISAQGYGETRLKNHCKDGTQCSEADHAINRRTEATLICRK